MDHHAQECRWCQATLSAASRLRFKKLGKHERRLLLAAPPPGGDPAPIVPPGPSHDDRTATRRAKDRLVKAGLIVVPEQTTRVTMRDNPELLRTLRKQYAVFQFMSRTAFGDEIARRYQRELETPGMRLRWLAARLEPARDAAIAQCPHRQGSKGKGTSGD